MTTSYKKYGIFCTSSKEIVLDAGETLEEAKELMSRLGTEEGKNFFGMTAQDKEIWTISAYFEPIEKVLLGNTIMSKYTIQAKKNAILQWEISGLSEKQATKQASEESETNPDLQIFVVFSDGYLNVDGHSPVGKAW